MGNKVLITGVSGFVGSHLADYLLAHEPETIIHGLKRWRSPLDNVKHLLPSPRVVMHDGDLKDMSSTMAILGKVKPDVIVHLAAQSFVPYSYSVPSETLATNVLGTSNLLEAVRLTGLSPRTLVVSSPEVYGQPDKAEPMNEDTPLKPLSPYAVSKVAEDMLGFMYHKAYRMDIVRSRAFSHCVSKWTPVILKDDYSGLNDIKYISELRRAWKQGGYLSGKMIGDIQVWDMRQHKLSVWSKHGWAKMDEISCHPNRKGKLVRILIKSGIIEITDNHSIIGTMDEPLEVAKLAVGDEVATTDYPTSDLTHVHPDVAWFLGFFVAEGCISGGKTRIDNTDQYWLDRAKSILLKHFGRDSYYVRCKEMLRLIVRASNDFSKWLYPQVYASDHNKRVPMSILNAQREAKLAFLEGYNAGDGRQNRAYFSGFKTKSRILAAGLCYLISQTTAQEIGLSFENRNQGYISIYLHSPYEEHKNWGEHLRGKDGVVKKLDPFDYDQEVWDLSTSTGMFGAGVGNLVAHNTGPRRGAPFMMSSFARQIALIEKGIQKPVIRVGNLDSVRTFCDVRDTARAYWLLVKFGYAGEVYNIGGDNRASARNVLDELLNMTPVQNIKVEVDPSLLRPIDVTLQIPDDSKFRKLTGWKPEIPLLKTLADTLQYWRENV